MSLLRGESFLLSGGRTQQSVKDASVERWREHLMPSASFNALNGPASSTNRPEYAQLVCQNMLGLASV